MKKLLSAFLLIGLSTIFATNMIITKIDGSSDSYSIDEIEQVTFEAGTSEHPGRVLFIGNSYTYFNGGIEAHLQSFVESAHPDYHFEAESITGGGYTLEMHYNTDSTLEDIANGNWDYVVLQEQSTRPVENPTLFYQYATLLDSVITRADSGTAFFMTWARQNDPAMIEELAAAYDSIGVQLDAVVCPVGRAWQNSLEENPLLILHSGDGSHPNVYGTYLAVCVFYACLFDESPVGVEYVNDEQITAEQRDFLQTIAWQTVLEYR